MNKIIKELTGHDPSLRLHVVLLMAIGFGMMGVLGFGFGLLGIFLILVSTPDSTITWAKVGNVIELSLGRIIIGFGLTIIVHAIVQLNEKIIDIKREK